MINNGYKFNGFCRQSETLNLVVFRIYSTLIIYYKIWVMTDVFVVMGSDFICAMMYRVMVIKRINIFFYGLMIC